VEETMRNLVATVSIAKPLFHVCSWWAKGSAKGARDRCERDSDNHDSMPSN